MSSDRLQAQDRAVVHAPPERVFEALCDLSGYPAWWPAALPFKVLKQEPGIVGSEAEIRPMGGYSFRARVSEVVRPERLVLDYVEGLYRGRGTWTLQSGAEAGTTEVCYSVDAEITNSMVRLLARTLDLRALQSKLMAEAFAGLDAVLRRAR